MKISLTQENLNKALTSVGRIVGGRASLPVLANVLLSTDKNRLRLSTTNLEIGINYWIGAKVEKTGSLTVPARLLSEYVASLPAGNIELEAEKNNLHITAAQNESTINGIAASEFPSIPVVGKATPINLPAASLKAALTQVLPAASVDDARPVLNGVYVFSRSSELVLVATDSYRLAEKKLKLDQKSIKDNLKVIIPARTLGELVRMIGDEVETIELLVEDNQAMFRFDGVELITRLIDGQFPDYQQLIPNEAQTTITIPTTEFTSLGKVAALFARENAGSVTIKLEAKTKTLSINSLASQIGENTSKVKVVFEGADAEVALNSRYLLDALAAMNTEEITFGVTGKVNPCLLRPVKEKDYLHLIMPLRS